MSSGKLFQCGKSIVLLSSKAASSSSPVSSLLVKNQFCNHLRNIRFYSNSSPPVPGDASKEPFIPAYKQKEGESVETLRARLLYQSRKRGMLENGLLLSTFAAKFLNSLTEVELRDYDRLINLPSNDWDIYYWATGVKPIPKEFDTAILHKFIDHVRNEDKESRLRQPDLN